PGDDKQLAKIHSVVPSEFGRPYYRSGDRQSKHVAPAVLQSGKIAAHLRQPRRMYGRDGDALLFPAGVRDHFPPRIHAASVAPGEVSMACGSASPGATCSDSRYRAPSGMSTSNRCSLRYAATTSPRGEIKTVVL